MKKIVSAILALTLVIGVMLVMTSCNTISGTYESDEIMSVKTTYKFKGDEVVKTVSSAIGSKTYYGEYEIKKDATDALTITFDWDDDENNSENDTKEGIAWSLVKEDDYIEIAGTKYTKIK